MAKAIRASALVLLLACSARAGYIQNDVAATPPPPANATQEEQTTEGVMPNPEADAFTEAVLSVVGSVLALL